MNKFFIDGDSFPRLARQAAITYFKDLPIEIILVTNNHQAQHYEAGPAVKHVVTELSKDAVDNAILAQATTKDLVVTLDILFAERLVARKIKVFNHLGEEFTPSFLEKKLLERQIALNLAVADPTVHLKQRAYQTKKLELFKRSLPIMRSYLLK